ncbi:MAG: hypothetical protein Q7T63_07040 [Burkholderiaceae bacterium]|nr:hypothetical protein [Burkholderiaceae bacterium]
MSAPLKVPECNTKEEAGRHESAHGDHDGKDQAMADMAWNENSAARRMSAPLKIRKCLSEQDTSGHEGSHGTSGRDDQAPFAVLIADDPQQQHDSYRQEEHTAQSWPPNPVRRIDAKKLPLQVAVGLQVGNKPYEKRGSRRDDASGDCRLKFTVAQQVRA